jgi:hypothetical protein
MQAVEQLRNMRTQLADDAKRLLQQRAAEYDNKLLQTNQKHKKELADAHKIMDLSSLSNVKEQDVIIQNLEAEHATALYILRKEFKATLDKKTNELNDQANKALDDMGQAFEERSKRERARFDHQIVNLDAGHREAIQNLTKAKDKADATLKAHAEKTTAKINEQQSHLQDAQAEIIRLSGAHHKDQEQLQQKVVKLEAMLVAMNSTQQGISPMSGAVNSEAASPQAQNSTSFRNSFLKPIRSHSGPIPACPGSANTDDVVPVENKSKLRTISRLNSIPSERELVLIYHDPHTSSSLSVPPSRSPSQNSQIHSLILRERPPSRQNSENSSSIAYTEPVENPFINHLNPPSKGPPLPNSASKRKRFVSHATNITMGDITVSFSIP